ncbi:MAG: GNAT family N-acetyltransferase [Vicinamibacterales bacterium]
MDWAPQRIETTRLLLVRPTAADAEAIFSRYASDPDVTHYLSWPRHLTVADTATFLAFSESEWNRWPAGPYLIRSRTDRTLLGGTGLSFETPWRAMTGYVVAKDSWGRGYATEALEAMVALARRLRVMRLYALCHPAHAASQRVLEKCGFVKEATLHRHSVFPNLDRDMPADTDCYAVILGD